MVPVLGSRCLHGRVPWCCPSVWFSPVRVLRWEQCFARLASWGTGTGQDRVFLLCLGCLAQQGPAWLGTTELGSA